MIFKLLIFLFFVSCQPAHISPHTKRGQAKIDILKVHTPYYVQHIVTDGVVPFVVKWEGPADKLIIHVEYIIRPTSPRRSFPIYQGNLMGNKYTVYRDLYLVKNINTFEGNLNVYEKGDYRISVFLSNEYWYEKLSSNFKIY